MNEGKGRKLDGDDTYTTVMLRNIPNKYTRQMLIDQLHGTGFKGNIDYLYLPTDFANKCNVGYCFLNFRTPEARARFMQAYDGVAAQSCLPGFNSYKVCQVTRAKWQGRDENVRRLRSGPELMSQLAGHPEWLPLLMDEQGNEEEFELGEPEMAGAVNSKPGKGRRNKGFGGGSAFENYMMGMESWGGYSSGSGKGRGKGSSAFDFGSYAGLPIHAMPVPVMTEYGVQYVPYEAMAWGIHGYGGVQPQMFGGMFDNQGKEQRGNPRRPKDKNSEEAREELEEEVL